MPQLCHPELLLSQAEGREMTQCILQSCYRSSEAQCFSPYWECHSTDGNPAVRVCPSAYHYSDKTTLNKLTKALELNRVIVCALFAVALITWLRIQTEAVFTDFLSKELAFISIWGKNQCVIIVIMMPHRQAKWNKSYTLLCSSKLQSKKKIPGAQISTGKKNPSDNW